MEPKTIKLFQGVFLLSFTIAMSCFIWLRSSEFHPLHKAVYYCQMAGVLGAMAVIQNHGNFLSPYNYSFFLIFFLIGYCMKIMHWRGADEVLILSLSAIIFAYTLRFIKKKKKIRLDFLKWLWIIFFTTGYLLKVMHWKGAFEIQFISWIILPLMLLEFILFSPYIGFLWKEPMADQSSNES